MADNEATGDQPDFDEDDIEILDSIWDKIGKDEADDKDKDEMDDEAEDK